MAGDASDSKKRKQAMGGQLVIPLCALGFTLYYFSTIWNSPWTAQVSAFLIGTILIVLVVIFLARAFIAVRSGEADWGLSDLVAPTAILPRRLGLLLLTMAYIVVLQWGGFTLTTFVYLVTAMLLLGGTRVLRPAIVLSFAFSVGGYLLFVAAFETRFPLGPFEQLMKELF